MRRSSIAVGSSAGGAGLPASRPQATEFTVEQMAGWFQPDGRLGVHGEIVIPQESTIEQTVAAVMSRT